MSTRPGPQWATAVMGTGIVANAAATLPVTSPLLLDAARVVWALAAGLLVWVSVATVRHLRWALDDPQHVHFLGAPAMAMLTVGAGILLLDLPARPVAVALWVVGTALGLATAVGVPYLAVTRHVAARDTATGAWLVPVVPPMVSAASGPLVSPHLALLCAALFGMSLIAGLLVVTTVWHRLVHHGVSASVVPLWIVLGVLGQSVTAAHTIAAAVPSPYALPLSIAYGVPVWGFALLWLALVVALTARARPAYTMAWWAFTFPLGTVVTGTSGLAAATGSAVLGAVAVGLYAALVLAWVSVVTATVRRAPRTWPALAVAR